MSPLWETTAETAQKTYFKARLDDPKEGFKIEIFE